MAARAGIVKKCEICGRDIGVYGFIRHQTACGSPPKISKPKPRVAWNKGLNKEMSPAIRMYAEKNSKRMKGIYPENIIKWVKENPVLAIEKCTEGGRNSGEYRKKVACCKHLKRLDSFGNFVSLQSSYEIRLAELLDQMSIQWIRPKGMEYHLEGILHKYYPDFYLPELDLFLDPKNLPNINNPKTKLKIDASEKENNVRILILRECDLNEVSLKDLLCP